MKLLLVAGFLGSGKTTLILQLARAAANSGRRVAILVNEVGEIGIDERLMRRLGFSVWELYSGCICCTLSADLVTTLQELGAGYAPDLVILEPSGSAEPGNILRALPYYRGNPLAGIRTLGVVDPLRLGILMEILGPLLSAQIRGSDLVLINKSDIASPEQIVEAQRTVAEINPGARVLTTNAAAGLDSGLLLELLP